VTVLRSGSAYSIPGRSVDLCEGGIAVVLGGEVRPTDLAGVEFLLPDLGLGLQTKAIVRHHSPLRCGFEFLELTRHQQAVIREWARQRLQAKPQGATAINPASVQPAGSRPLPNEEPGDGARLRRFLWLAVGVLALAGLLVWWHWQRGWRELEEQIPQPAGRTTTVTPNYFLAVSGTAGHTEL
jgi:hypothetical protein